MVIKRKVVIEFRQPLIGEDVLIPRHKCKTLYRFVAYSRYFYFVTINFYQSIAVIILEL